ncbi:MAG TPA: F0F1 ATP synthase subunit A [Candidatus Paceibacterota bacterium]|jgi:F-type H+-transporting ATPase subunit a
MALIAYAAETVEHGAEAAEHAGGGMHVVLKAEPVGHFLGLTLTNSLLMTWVVMAVLVIFALLFRRKIALIPGKLQAGVEWLFEGVLGYMEDVLEDAKLARRFFPLVMTIFLFVLVGNEMAFLPGVGSIGVEGEHGLTPLFRAPGADLNFTLALAFISFFTIEIASLAILGAKSYGGKYFNFHSISGFFVGIIEIISNLGRIISFSFRLFGNIFAGEVMIVVAMFFVAYLLPVPLMAFEVFVGFIQAVVFAMLTLFFIKLAIMDPHAEH